MIAHEGHSSFSISKGEEETNGGGQKREKEKKGRKSNSIN